MSIEQGIVIKLGRHGPPATVWVKTARASACESCASRESCNPGRTQSQEVEAINEAGACVGDRIQISISTAAILKATSLLYLFPVLCMLAGGILGNLCAPYLLIDASVAAAVAAMSCFGASVLIVRARGRRLGQQAAYRPKIIRIISRKSDEPEITSGSGCAFETVQQ